MPSGLVPLVIHTSCFFSISLFGCLFVCLSHSISFGGFSSSVFCSILRFRVLLDRLPHTKWYWHHYWIIIMLIYQGISLSFNAFAIVLYVVVNFSRNVNYYDPNCALKLAVILEFRFGFGFAWSQFAQDGVRVSKKYMPIGTWKTKIRKKIAVSHVSQQQPSTFGRQNMFFAQFLCSHLCAKLKLIESGMDSFVIHLFFFFSFVVIVIMVVVAAATAAAALPCIP